MLRRYGSRVGLCLARYQVSGLRHVAFSNYARKVCAARPKIGAVLIRLIVFGAYRKRAEQPRELAVRAKVFSVDGVGRKVSKATAFSQSAKTRAAEAFALSVCAAESQPFA